MCLIPNEVIGFFNWPKPSSHTVALGLTQPLTEKCIRNLSVDEGRLALKADNLTAICELIVQKMRESQHLTTPGASVACYRDAFTEEPTYQGILFFNRRLSQWRIF
jgi:hypothetical protein